MYYNLKKELLHFSFIFSIIILGTCIFLSNVSALEYDDLRDNKNSSEDVCVKYDNITRTIIICDGIVRIPTISSYFNNDLVYQVGEKEWLLKSNIMILENATLIIDGSSAKTIKIDSDYSKNTPYSIISRGNLKIDNTKILGWNSTSNSPPFVNSPETIRPYILTFWNSAGKTDITNSYLENLGYKGYVGTEGISYLSGEGSLISNNTIVGNYLGLHLMNNVSDIKIKDNRISKSYTEGIKLDTKANNIEIGGNTIEETNLHAIVCLRECNNVVIKDNVLQNNIGIGILIDKKGNNVTAENNYIQSNTMGMMISESKDNNIYRNIIDKNGNGIFIKKATGISIINNNISKSNNYGINLYSNSSWNRIANNHIQNSSNSGINIAEYGTQNNMISGNLIEGGLNIGVRLDRIINNIFESNIVDKNKREDYFIKSSHGNIIRDSLFNNTSFMFSDKRSNIMIVNTDNSLLSGNNVTNMVYPINNTIEVKPVQNLTKLTTLDMQVFPNSSYVNISSLNNDFSKNKDYKRWNGIFPEKIETKFVMGGLVSGNQYILKTNKTILDLVSVEKNNNIEFIFNNDEQFYKFELESTKTPMFITLLLLSMLIVASIATFFFLRRRRKIKENNQIK